MTIEFIGRTELILFHLQEKLGLHGVFWLYSGISCIGLIFVVTCVPETKGKDLDEMHPKFVQTMTITNNR